MIDASVAVKWFVEEAGRENAMTVLSQPDGLAAPDLVILEVSNVLKRKVRAGTVTLRQLQEACETIQRCFSHLVAAGDLIDEAVRLAIELDHSVYDCAYLACARILDTRLVTADDRFLAKVTRISRLSPYATGLATF